MSITYDLYVKQSGRWLLEKQYEREERSDAIHEAKRMMRLPGIAAAKVVRERYDRHTQLAMEHTVFDSAEAAQSPIAGAMQPHEVRAREVRAREVRAREAGRREFGRRGTLPLDVHRSWDHESDISGQEYWEDVSLFDDYAALEHGPALEHGSALEHWQALREDALQRVRAWTRNASVFICGSSVGLILIGAAWIAT